MSTTGTGREAPSPLQRFLIWIMPLLTPVRVWAYRALGGRFLDRTPAGGPVLLLTTTGRRSGLSRTVALGYLDDGDDLYVAASNGGKPQEPGWIFNVRADPSVEVEVGRDRFTTRAQVLEGARGSSSGGATRTCTRTTPTPSGGPVEPSPWSGSDVPSVRRSERANHRRPLRNLMWSMDEGR